MSRLLAALDRHWFAPASLRDLALVRILAFGTQTLFFIFFPGGYLRSLDVQLSDPSLLAPPYRPIVVLKVLLLPWGGWGDVQPSVSFLAATLGVAIVAGVLATVGLYARVTMLLAAAANTLRVAHWNSYGDYHHSEGLMIIALNVLAVAPSAAVWSVDAARRRRAERGARAAPVGGRDDLSVFARWPRRLMQWLIALTYLSAAYSKLRFGGLEWMNGYTMAYHFLGAGMREDRDIAYFLATLPPWLHVLPSIATVLLELTFFVAVLVPRTAWLYVLAGVCMHLSIYASMGIAFFQTILLYSVFVESLRRYWPRILRPPLPRLNRGSVVRQPAGRA